MMNKNGGLQLFLEGIRGRVTEAIENRNGGEERFIYTVLGNESGDLDSVVSAVIYAYFKQNQVKSESNDVFIPIANFPKDDIALKTEVNAVFERFGISATSCLVFKDCLSKLCPLIKEVILVDHNELAEDLQFLRDFVTIIIDHHNDNGVFEDPYVTKTIENVGSCCTLVAEKIYNQTEELLAEFLIADLLMSAILLDTVNLKPGIGRTTEKDVEFCEELEKYVSLPIQELFDIAQKAKYAVLHLSVTDILRKDLKVYSGGDQFRIGISSVTASAENFLAKEGVVDETLSFAVKNILDIVMIMFIHTKDDIALRELAVCSNDKAMHEKLLAHLLQINDLQLLPCSELRNIQIFTQGNSKFSRKVLSPYVIRFLNEATSSNQLSSNGNYGPKVSSNHPSPHSDIREPTTNGSLDRIAVYSDYSGTTAEGIVNTSEVRANLTGLISKEDDRDIDRSIDRSFEDSPSGMIDESNEDLSLSSSLVHEPSLRAALHEAYVDLDRGIEQPSLEYEETWKSEMYEVKVPDQTSVKQNQKHKIIIRDLSFDDNGPFSELTRIDLLCPVFLAVTEDEEDDDYVLKDIRRKTKSIENLCSTLDEEQGHYGKRYFPLRRTKSELPSKYATPKRGNVAKRSRVPSTSDRERLDRNDSIKEEDDPQDVNPFTGDRELGESAGQSSLISSTSYQDELMQEAASESEDNTTELKQHKKQNGLSRAVDTFSFSDDDTHSYEGDQSPEKVMIDSPTCSCSQSDWSSLECCPHHVKGLWDRFITVSVNGLLRVVDLKLIDPYLKVITHGGYHETADERRVVMVFTAEYLPRKYIPKYSIVMEQLFYYAVHTIDLSVHDTYDIVYFNSRGSNQPGLDWLRKCYDMVERRLKKNLSTLYIVHPDFWFKTVVRFYKPFISSKFSKNIKFIKSLKDLRQYLSLEYIFIPDEVKRNDPDYEYWLHR